MRCLVALASILFITASHMECASGQTPCEVVAERNCRDLWPNPPYGYVGCGGTPCDPNNKCPDDTEALGPIPDVYNEIMEQWEAQAENLAYYGPYETFSSPGDVYCQYKITCKGCKLFLDANLCHTDLQYHDIDDLVELLENQPIIHGVTDCWQ